MKYSYSYIQWNYIWSILTFVGAGLAVEDNLHDETDRKRKTFFFLSDIGL